MLVLLSPAKKLNLNHDNTLYKKNYTKFENQDKVIILLQELKKYTPSMLKDLMGISEELAILNYDRFQNWELNPFIPCIFMFNGDVYEGLQAQKLNPLELAFCQQHIRILSGLYGILRPLDLIKPYRLEMGTKINFQNFRNLYEFWGPTQTEYLNAYFDNLKQEERIVINLASDEYFKSIKPKYLRAKVIKIVFEQFKNSKYKNISFLTKYARGLMANYIITNQIKDIESLKEFNINGYAFQQELSGEDKLVFRV